MPTYTGNSKWSTGTIGAGDAGSLRSANATKKAIDRAKARMERYKEKVEERRMLQAIEDKHSSVDRTKANVERLSILNNAKSIVAKAIEGGYFYRNGKTN